MQSIGCDLSKGMLAFKKDGQAVLSFSAQPLFFWDEKEGASSGAGQTAEWAAHLARKCCA